MKKSYIIILTILVSLILIGAVGSATFLNSTKVQQALSKLFDQDFIDNGNLILTGDLTVSDAVSVGTTYKIATSLAADVATYNASGDNVTLIVTTPQTLTASLTVNSNITLKIMHGGSINGAYTLTINGPFEGSQGCFGSSVTVAGLDYAEPGWWGTNAAAITSALGAISTGGLVDIAPGTYADVTITASGKTVRLSDGVVFQTSSAGLTPALQISGCTQLEIQGRIVIDGNKANNANALDSGDIGYEYGAVAFYDSSLLSIGDVYVYNAWHDGIGIESVTDSQFGNFVVKDSQQRGFVFYEDCSGNHINSVLVDTTTDDHGVRIGGASGSLNENNIISSIIVKSSAAVGVLFEHYSDQIKVESINVYSAGNNGVKVEDVSNILIDQVTVKSCFYNGLSINASKEGTENVVIGRILSIGNATATTTLKHGVYILSTGGCTTSGVSIGQIISKDNGNGTQAGCGVKISGTADSSTTVEDINIGSILATGNYGYGVVIDDTPPVIQNININNLIALDNTVADLRIENDISSLNISNIIAENTSNRPSTNTIALTYGAHGGGYDTVVRETELTLSGASTTWAGAVPNFSILSAITTVVTEEIVINTGTKWKVGTAANPDRWGVETAIVVVGKSMKINNYDGDDAGPVFLGTGTDVVLTPDAGTFTSGKVRITAQYLVARGSID